MSNSLQPNLLDRVTLIEHVAVLQKQGAHNGYCFKLQAVSHNQLQALVDGKEALSKLSPRDFEVLISELLHADGYQDIELVPRLNAPGPDIIAYNKSPLGDKQKFIIEVKNWEMSVNIDVIRTMMYRVDQQYQATGGLIVITKKFTEVAKEAAQIHEWRLSLKEGADVRKWIARHASDKVEYTIEHKSLNTSGEGKEILRLLDYEKGLSLQLAENTPCKKCGGMVICGYIDLGAVDYYDNYFHLCSGCLECMHMERYEQSGNEESASCPFCMRVWEGPGANTDTFLSRLVAGID